MTKSVKESGEKRATMERKKPPLSNHWEYLTTDSCVICRGIILVADDQERAIVGLFAGPRWEINVHVRLYFVRDEIHGEIPCAVSTVRVT